MPVELRMPKLGLTMESGRVVEWRKKVGERVAKGETLLLVETEKITNEIKSPADGIIARIVAQPGDEVPVGGLLALIATSPEEYEAVSKEGGVGGEAPSARVGEDRESPISEAGLWKASGVRERVRATPAARRLAQKMGVDLRRVRGTGPRGMVTVKDVERVAREGSVGAEGAVPVQGSGGEAAVMVGVEYEEVAMSPMRARIAENLHKSYAQAIHTTLHMEACVDRLLELRESLPRERRPSITAFVVKAVAQALVKHPFMNATVSDGRIIRYRRVNVGVAVALENGLILPVIRDADKKSLGQVWRELEDLSRRGREGKLSLDDVEGSTFSVSNLGMYGVDSFTPIIYPGHAGVLGVGRVRERLVPGEDGGYGVRRCMVLSLTFDHRVVDGAQAAVFLSTVREFLENPLPWLLDL